MPDKDRNELDFAHLEVVTSYPSVVEAGLALHILDEAGIRAKMDQEAVATWFSHVGTALGGVHVLVLQSDLQAASELLSKLQADDHFPEAEVQRAASEYLSLSDEEEDEDEEAEEKYPHLDQAFLAAMLAVNAYSVCLVLHYELWRPENGGKTRRFYGLMIMNAIVFVACGIALAYFLLS